MAPAVLLLWTGVSAAILGILFSMRIGGADMPVLISFLNATAGLAAAWCGIALQNRLLITFGATVAASGSILTHVMCKGLLYEMDAINAEFKTTDLALVVGACDVVNPAAMAIEGTPLSGMPILMAQDAEKIIVCNLDEKPGYSGVENLLYRNPKTILLFGDAQKTTSALIEGLSPQLGNTEAPAPLP